MKIIEKSGYQALPWVRYITQSGGKAARLPGTLGSRRSKGWSWGFDHTLAQRAPKCNRPGLSLPIFKMGADALSRVLIGFGQETEHTAPPSVPGNKLVAMVTFPVLNPLLSLITYPWG